MTAVVAKLPVRLIDSLVKVTIKKYIFSSVGNIRYQVTVNVMWLFSNIRSGLKHTKTFSINFQMLMTAVWHELALTGVPQVDAYLAMRFIKRQRLKNGVFCH